MISIRNTALAAFALAGASLLPGIAQAQAPNGYATGNVNMRQGPSTSYAVITTIPRAASVTIYGCLSSYSWCDVDWRGYRGWVSANYLDFFYGGQRYAIIRYGAQYAIPVITFNFGTYVPPRPVYTPPPPPVYTPPPPAYTPPPPAYVPPPPAYVPPPVRY